MKSTFRTIALLALFGGFCNCPAFGQRVSDVPIPDRSNVVIDPMNGFGSRKLKAALLEEGVPLNIVSNKGMAEFEIAGSIQSTEGVLFLRVSILNLKTGDIAWGYGAAGPPSLQSAAASCAKQLKQAMRNKH